MSADAPDRNRCIPVAEVSERVPAMACTIIIPANEEGAGEVRAWLKGHAATMLGLTVFQDVTIRKQAGIT